MITQTIWRIYPANQWHSITATALAAAVTQPAALRPMSRAQFLSAIAAAGAAPADLRPLYAFPAYMTDVDNTLRAGSLPEITALLALCPVDLPAPTLAAIQTVIQANTLRAIDQVATDMHQTAPAAVTAANVTAALNAAGYTWQSNRWTYTP